MVTRAPSPRQLTLSIAFVVICAVLSILAYETFGGSIPLSPQGYRFQVPLPDAGNLSPGSDVEISGVTVGRVVRIDRAGNRALATVQLQPQYAPMHSGATAIMRTKTLLGEAYIELALGPNGAPPIPDGGRLGASHVHATVSLDQFLSALAPNTRAQMRQLFAGLSHAFAGRAPALGDALGHAPAVSGNFATVLGTLAKETPQLQQLFNASGTVLAALGQREGDLRAAIAAGDSVLSTTAARSAALSGIVRAFPPFLAELKSTAGVVTADSGDLDRAVSVLLPIAPIVAPVLTQLADQGAAYTTTFRALPATIRAGRAGLPILTHILDAIPGAFEPTYLALQQLIPITRLFGVYTQPALVGPIADTASMVNGRTIVDRHAVSRTNLSLYVSNETVAGWVKRLPTDRSNPYPEPGALSELTQLGYLKSYDCRNVHNPLYLPPLGTGVPPCVTQGPWTYDGVTAYYPRLKAWMP